MVSHSDQIRPQRSTKKRLSCSNLVSAPFSVLNDFNLMVVFFYLFALYHVIRNFTKLLDVCPVADLLWFCLFGSSVSQTPWICLVPYPICWWNALSNHYYNFSFTDVYVKIPITFLHKWCMDLQKADISNYYASFKQCCLIKICIFYMKQNFCKSVSQMKHQRITFVSKNLNMHISFMKEK